ncbi:cation:proton antiporter [Candidatus Gottesmanbacteria bacterium]|nr:cation:proton antiporter [Candidatus Gottesmanbacteria bacterium]
MSPNNFSLITTLLLVFAAAFVGGFVAKRLKQPLVLGYIVGGFVVGNFLRHVVDIPALSSLSDIGVTLLLFTLGIEFSFARLKGILPVVGWAAGIQILFVLGVVLLLLQFFGFSFFPALFIAAAAALSSTALVVKLLSDRGELDTIPGQVATGWLVVQDLAVVPMMVVLPTLVGVFGGGSSMGLSITKVALSILTSAVFLGLVIVLGRKILPKLFDFVATVGSREMLVVAIAGVVLTVAAASAAVGLSMAIGAFIAGLLVAETTQNHAVFAEVRPMRDLFGIIFFVTLGFALPASFLVAKFIPVVTTTVAIIGLKWVIILALARFVGYHRKTAFLVAISLTQMSEFGLVLGKEGVAIGALTSDQSSFLTAITCGSLFLTVPLVNRAHEWYYRLAKSFGSRLPVVFPTKEEVSVKGEQYPIADHIVLCGYGRVGKYIGRALLMANIPFLVVDYNHGTIMKLQEKGIAAIYGDPAEREVLDFAQVDLARAIIIAIPDRHTQEMVIAHAHSLNRRIKIICRTHFEEDQSHLKSLGVHTVVQPEFEAAIAIVARVLGEFGQSEEAIAGKVSRLKIEHGLG